MRITKSDRSKAVFLLWIINVISVFCLLRFRARRFIDALWYMGNVQKISHLSLVWDTSAKTILASVN